jgi:hypothetical protein
MKMLA